MKRDIEVSPLDIESLAVKLSEFIDTLTPGERSAFQIVEWYLAISALEEEHDVRGYVVKASADREGFWQSLTAALVSRHAKDADV